MDKLWLFKILAMQLKCQLNHMLHNYFVLFTKKQGNYDWTDIVKQFLSKNSIYQKISLTIMKSASSMYMYYSY